MLFDDFHRTDERPKLSRESEFAFTNRSPRREIANVRTFLNALVSAYPKESQIDIVRRMRCGDDQQYQSACFELMLYSLLTSKGYSVEPHPTLPNGRMTRPDFFVTAPKGSTFYLEAVNCSEQNEAISGSPITKTFMDVFTTNSHPNFLVSVSTSGTPKTQPSGSKYIKALISWLDKLDPDVIDAKLSEEGYESLPRHAWTHEGFEVEVTPIPLRPEHRGSTIRLLGMHSGGAGWIDSKGAVRQCVKFKGSKYGKPGAPFLVAVNFFGYGLDRVDEVQALFGDETMVVPLNPKHGEPYPGRERNGLWIGREGPLFTRISGVWIFNRLSPYDLTSRSGTLYFNPCAAYKLPSDLEDFAHCVGKDNGDLVWRKGPTFGSMLGLPPEWPEC